MLRLSARSTVRRFESGVQNVQMNVKYLLRNKPTTLVTARGFIAPAYELAKKVIDVICVRSRSDLRKSIP